MVDESSASNRVATMRGYIWNDEMDAYMWTVIYCCLLYTSEMGVGMRLTKSYGEQLVDGILNLMHTQGMWAGETKPPRKPIVSKDEVAFINADKAGIFIPSVEHNGIVKKGQELAVIADPLTGEVRQTLMAPADGLLFTLREYPVVYPGSLLARILTGGFQK